MLSVLEYRQSGSLLLLIGIMTYYVVVPVLSRKEQMVSAYGILVLAVPYCIAVSDLGNPRNRGFGSGVMRSSGSRAI